MTWVGGDLTWTEKQLLLESRKKYPVLRRKCCQMLYYIKGDAYCLVKEMFGEDKLDKNCIEHRMLDGKKVCKLSGV